MSEWVLGVIGGSGLYEMGELENTQWIKIDTPWGDPSDEILFAELDGVKLRFLPRHSRGHALSPSGLNYRANIETARLRVRKAFLQMAWSLMSLWLTRFVSAYPHWREMRPKRRTQRCISAGHISRWKARNFLPARRVSFTANGGAT